MIWFTGTNMPSVAKNVLSLHTSSRPPPAVQVKLAPAGVSLADVLITPELSARPHRRPIFESESRALRTLARVAGNCPEKLPDALLELALELCHADTAVLSLLETTSTGDRIFRWTNLAGALSKHSGGSMPRECSPCGVCLDRKAPQLFSHPDHYFHYLNGTKLPFVEVLVVPLGERDPLGTIWIVSHNPERKFDAEDVRIMTSLAEFASSALEMIRLWKHESQSRQKTESELQDRTTMLRRLSTRLIHAQDAERCRIARALHDSVGQSLAALKIELEQMADGAAPHYPQHLSACLREVEQCLSETRTISHLLHPPTLDEAGLVSATRWYVEEFSRRCKIATHCYVSPDIERMAHDVELVLFRTLQEGLTNVHHHSRSPRVEIRLDLDAENIVLTVRDYGCGMPPGMAERFRNNGNGLGVGLAGMRGRVRELIGRIDLQSGADGTTITVSLPRLTNDGAAAA